MDGFIAQEHCRGQYVAVSRTGGGDISIAVVGARGANKSHVELDAEQAHQLGTFLVPSSVPNELAGVLRDLVRAMHRYEATDEVDLVGEDTCWEAAALRNAANQLIALVDPIQRQAWREEDATQWAVDYPAYAAKVKVSA
jgi:hypothetical protein